VWTPGHLPVVWCFVPLLIPLGLVITNVIRLDVINIGYTIYFTIGSRWLLLRPLRLEVLTLGLKVRPLHQKLGAGHLYWHWRPVHRKWLEKLVRLREARPNVTP
jgi:hypothetical protein